MTRLDNDDALHINYIEQMQGRFLKEFLSLKNVNPWQVNLSNGFKYDILNNKLYTVNMHNSPFHTVFQYVTGKQLWGFGNHSTIHLTRTTKQDDFAGWLMILHERNVYNRIKTGDKEVSLNLLEVRFAFAE